MRAIEMAAGSTKVPRSRGDVPKPRAQGTCGNAWRWLILALLTFPGIAQAEYTLGGQYRNLLVVPWRDNYAGLVDQNGVRLDFQAVSEDSLLRFRATLDVIQQVGSADGLTLASYLTGPRGIPDTRLQVELYRAFLQYREPTTKLELSLGRQRVAWGSGLVLRPSDPFEPMDYFDPHQELSGVNALRIRLPAGPRLYLDAISRISDDANRVQVGAAAGFRIQDVIEVAASVVHDGIHGREQVGLNVLGTGVFQYWLDGAYRRQVRDNNNPYSDLNQVLLEAGLGYTLPMGQGLKLSAEYIFLSNGEPLETSGQLESAWQDYRVLQARNYGFARAELQVNDAVGMEVGALVNVDDGSWHIRPGLTWRPLNALELALQLQLFNGRLDGEFQRTELPEVEERTGLASLRVTWEW